MVLSTIVSGEDPAAPGWCVPLKALRLQCSHPMKVVGDGGAEAVPKPVDRDSFGLIIGSCGSQHSVYFMYIEISECCLISLFGVSGHRRGEMESVAGRHWTPDHELTVFNNKSWVRDARFV